ncbi:cytochrome b-245 heavy chain [Patella vulgata]|uniref:cytochrome b-245 heavy chain n=1 Tax=Patella vulgata TaxID=6465 RepID=UPI00218061DD|nr:cytochrome b-245 heavy chain [Patella vulgata]
MGELIVNELPKWIVVSLWLIINVAIFLATFFSYQSSAEYFYLRLIVGNALCVARASAACLNFNCLLVLLPVCRNFVGFIKGACVRCHRVRRQFDRQITYHKYTAYMICLQTAIHISAHCFDFERMITAYDNPDKSIQAVSNLPTTPNGTWVNPVRNPSTDATREAVSTVSGVSGIIITLCLILILSSSAETIRQWYFELFWYMHHLFIIFFIGLGIHGIQQIIHKQTNISSHNPENCYKKFDQWDSIKECPIPQFSGSPPQSWIWILIPVIIFIIERIVRFVRSFQKVVITKVVKHPSNVYELQMQKKGFYAEPGQYVFLHCPSISQLEWHPFTLTSAPGEDHISVHIRRAGDWTEELAKKCHVDEEEFQEAWKLPKIAIDGPYGTATEDFFRFDIAVLIASGIGVTPFASVLRYISHKYSNKRNELQLKNVHLYWVCPSTSSFEWLQDLLISLEMQMAQIGKADFLTHNIYLTSGWDFDQAKNIFLHDNSERDVVTGLQQKTHYGRPQWNKVFSDLANAHKGMKIGVFFCGSKELSTKLHRHCNENSSESTGTRFYYNKENF